MSARDGGTVSGHWGGIGELGWDLSLGSRPQLHSRDSGITSRAGVPGNTSSRLGPSWGRQPCLQTGRPGEHLSLSTVTGRWGGHGAAAQAACAQAIKRISSSSITAARASEKAPPQLCAYQLAVCS